MRGDGRIFRRTGSRYWWCAYYDAKGTEKREVCRNRKGEKLEATAENEQAARKYLAKLVDAVTTETGGGPAFLGPEMRRLSVNAILDKLEGHYKLGGKRGIPREVGPQMKSHIKPLRAFFGNTRAVAIDEVKVQEFMSLLLSKRKQNATINRSLQLLKQAYKVGKLPCAFSNVSMLDESGNVRKGKFSQAEVARLIVALPPYIADVAEFAYETGARSGETLKLRWNYVQGDAIEVPASDTKNRKPRSIVVTETVSEIISRRRKARVPDCDLIFHNKGDAIKDYRKAWHSACVLAGLGRFLCRTCRNEQGKCDSVLDAHRKCPRCGKKWEVPRYDGRIMHDFRRSAAHEMWRAGSTVEECMEVTGHATAAMFKRYADLFSADERREMQRKVQERRRMWRDEQNNSSVVSRRMEFAEA
jgi:integrase